jgi:hypothetical protein
MDFREGPARDHLAEVVSPGTPRSPRPNPAGRFFYVVRSGSVGPSKPTLIYICRLLRPFHATVRGSTCAIRIANESRPTAQAVRITPKSFKRAA